MSEPTKEDMLCAISAAFSCYRTWRWSDEFGAKEQEANERIEYAIRRLIKERGEWEKKIRRFRRRAMVLKEAADETGVWIENIEKFLGDVIHELGKGG